MKHNYIKFSRGKQLALSLLYFAALMVLPVASVMAQTSYTISGTVTDSEDDSPIIGAQVFIDGTTSGTATDLDGNYTISLKVEENSSLTLVARFVGYATQRETIDFGSQTSITVDFSMAPDLLRLSEVVVTGSSGLQEKKQLGNTISTVDGKSIQDANTVDVTAALSGKFAGVQVTQNSGDPAAGISVRLRSASTVNGSSDPLYIIDGVIVNNSSTNVLGVTSVVQNRLTDVNPEDIERIEVIKGAAAAAIYGSRASNGVVQIFTKRGQLGKPKVTFSSSLNINSLRKKIDFNEAPIEWDNAGDPTDMGTFEVTRYDYQDEVFRTGIGNDNYLSISGGANNTTYFASVGFLTNEGIIRGQDFNRVTGRVRLTQQLNDWASVNLGSFVSSNRSNDLPNGGYGFGVIQTILFANNITDPAADEDGNYNTMTFYPNLNEYIETMRFQQFNERSINDITLNLSPFEGFTATYVLGMDNSSSRGERFVPPGTTTNPGPGGEATTRSINSKLINNDLNMVYEKEISSMFKTTTALGGTYQYDNLNIMAISANNLVLGVSTTDAGASTGNEFRSERAIWGAYLQETIDYGGKLFLTLAGRLDGASVFGEDERNQFYPKASVSYILSDEEFFNTSGAFNNVKLRAAWGQAGNLTAINPYTTLTNYATVTLGDNTGFISPSSVGNPFLRPERMTEIEVGADIALLNNRLALEMTYYTQDIEDLLLPRTLAPTTGAGSRVENIGTMTNRGLEVQITGTPIVTKDLQWTVIGTFSRNRNEVNGIEGDEFAIGNFGFARAKNGNPLGVFKQGYFARNDDGGLLLDPNGIPQRERGEVNENGENVPLRDMNGQPAGTLLQKIIGDPNPDYIASLINELSYKNWSFRMQWDAVQGFDVLSWDSRMLYRFGGGEISEQELNGEVTKGTGRAYFGIAEAYIEDGSFTKLRELSLSYNLREPFNGMDNLRFTLSGRNLISIDNYSKWDPEVNMDAQSNGSRGGIMGLTPIPRVITFGFTATF